MRQTTRAQCIATVQSLKEVQKQLQTLYFVHKKFDKTVIITVKSPKMALMGGGQFWKVSYVKVGRAYLIRKVFLPTPFGV